MVTSTTRGKSESVTFKIESEALRKLRREAGQKDISTNTLVNKLIKDYLNWYSNAAKAGFIPVRRPFLSKIIKYLPEQEITRQGLHNRRQQDLHNRKLVVEVIF